jgi:acyl-coenzyme A synthetase/AMP-(fatty) acid ligase
MIRNSKTPSYKAKLFDGAFDVLKRYNVAYFYCNPRRLHLLYRELVQEISRRRLDVLEITHLDEISK